MRLKGNKCPRKPNTFLIMTKFAKAILILMLAFAPVAGWSMVSADGAGKTAMAHEEKGVSPKPAEIGNIAGFPITNSMVVTWIVALGLIIFAQMATRQYSASSLGIQNFCEWLVESLYNFL